MRKNLPGAQTTSIVIWAHFVCDAANPPSLLPSFSLRPCLLFVVHRSPSGCPSRRLLVALSQFSQLIPVPPHEQLLMAAVGDSEVVVVVTIIVIVLGSGIIVSEL